MIDLALAKKIIAEGLKKKNKLDALQVEEDSLGRRLRKRLSGKSIRDNGTEELTLAEKKEQRSRVEKKEKYQKKINKYRHRLLEALLVDKNQGHFTEETWQSFLNMRALLARDQINLDDLFAKILSFTGDLSHYTKKKDQVYLLLINTPESKSIFKLVQKIFTEWDKTDLERFCKAENLRNFLKKPHCDLKYILENLNNGFLPEEINRVIIGLNPQMLIDILVLSATLPLPFQPNLELVGVISRNLSTEHIETVLKTLSTSTVANVEVLDKIRNDMTFHQQQKALNWAISHSREPSMMFIETFSSSGHVDVGPAYQKALLLSPKNPQMELASEILSHKQNSSRAANGRKRFSFNPDEIKNYSKLESLKAALLKVFPDFIEIEGIIATLPISARETFFQKEMESASPDHKMLNVLIHYVTPTFRNAMIEKFEPARIQQMLIFAGTLPFVPDRETVIALFNQLSSEQREVVLRGIVSQATPNPDVIKVLASDENVKTDAALYKVLLMSKPNMKVAKPLYRRASEPFKNKNGQRYEDLLQQSGENSLVSPVHAFKKLSL